jgi:hypothetical protein
MMKTAKGIFGLLLYSVVIIALSACNPQKTEPAVEEHPEKSSSPDEWKEMDEFHSVMADSFHPYMESKDLGPAKANADKLVTLAGAWANSVPPEKDNNETVKEMLVVLDALARGYLSTVKSGDDEAIGEALTKVHDQFHEIQDAWYHGEEEEQESESH